MKIKFEQEILTKSELNTKSQKRNIQNKKDTNIKTAASYGCCLSFDGGERAFFKKEGRNATKKIDEFVEKIKNTDIDNRRNYLTVASHTMSNEDFQKMEKEGFSIGEMSDKEVVTILDKIKAELIKSGENIQGYTDDLDLETLALAVGDAGYAKILSNTFKKYDIPLTEDNIEKVQEFLEITDNIEPLKEETIHYILSNDLKANMNNIILGSNSGTDLNKEKNQGYFTEDVNGYITKNTSSNENLDQILEKALVTRVQDFGFEGTEEEMESAKWLLENNIDITRASISNAVMLNKAKIPVELESLVDFSVKAIVDAENPMERDILTKGTKLEKAQEILNYYHSEQLLQKVTDRRQLEEVRLLMTIEANLKLLESDFSIETTSIEETVKRLKEVEKEMAKNYFGVDETSLSKYRTYRNTENIIRQIPELPVKTMGILMNQAEEKTVDEFYQIGKSFEAKYKEVEEKYEAIGTAPRRDLGDSLLKAFGNVEKILEDIGYESTDENQRLVRILGYNQMEVTDENIEQLRLAVNKVENIIEKLTPAATLRMIREGINPLETSFHELEEYFSTLPNEYYEETEKYSSFLYSLDLQKTITEEEREAFIGCYRLLHQIEKNDGSAIGNVIKINAELNFTTLLSAVRSGKYRGIDITIDESVGMLQELVKKEGSISDQIEKNIEKVRANLQREDMEKASQVSDAAFKLLEQGKMTPSTNNLLAANELVESFEQWIGKRIERKEKAREVLKLYDSMENDDFKQEYKQCIENQIEELEKEMIEPKEYIEVKEMQLFYKQLTIAKNLIPEEEYFLPMEISGKIVNVHMRIISNEEIKGKVKLTLSQKDSELIEMEFQLIDKQISGFIFGNDESNIRNLSNQTDILFENWIHQGYEVESIDFIFGMNKKLPQNWEKKVEDSKIDNKELFIITKGILTAIKQLEN